eukprot:CAMPEP_0197601330 /NCGR_PEP_ID=MMETSP1326-20131121/35098_1 /TAXON_ID=1155430 /ORGANISM="Genus nov. species nov., Strain RCC2288" /LENGTH=47 /DNA_ID= /DNA_START= /DNA_END= /DNA_ORIENTATION=
MTLEAGPNTPVHFLKIALLQLVQLLSSTGTATVELCTLYHWVPLGTT